MAKRISFIEGTADITVGTSATVTTPTDFTAVPLDVRNYDHIRVFVDATGEDAGASGNATLVFQVDYTDADGKQAGDYRNIASIDVAFAAGSLMTADDTHFDLDVESVDFLRLYSIANSDASKTVDVNVYARRVVLG